MKDGNYYLNLIRKNKGMRYFSSVADILGISKQAVSIIRKGGGIDPETAEKIGHILGIKPGIVLADINAAKATDTQTKKFWEKISVDLGRAAALLLPIAFTYQCILCKIRTGARWASTGPGLPAAATRRNTSKTPATPY